MVNDEDFENIDPGQPRVLIEEGIYLALWEMKEIRKYAYGEKLVFFWKVYMSADLSRSVPLCGYYGLIRNRAGRFMFGPHHGYRHDWIAANDGRWPEDPKKLPISIWEGRKFHVKVSTVKMGFRGPLHPSCYYSRVKRVIRPVSEFEGLEGLPPEFLNN